MLPVKRRAAALIIVVALSAGAASCREVFTTALNAVYVRTDLVLAWLLRPPGPAVTFTSPADGSLGVALNQSVIVCFNEKVVLPEGDSPFLVQRIVGAEAVEDVPVTCELAVTAPGIASSDTIQVIPPEGGYVPEQSFRVSLVHDIYTADGEIVDPGGFFPLDFSTGKDSDTVPPRVISTVPLDYQSTDHKKPVITVQFDDDVVPATGTLALYRFDHATQKAADEPVQIAYTAARAGAFNTISYTLHGDLDEYRIYQAVVKGVRDTSGNPMLGNRTGEGAATDEYVWRFFTGPVVVAVEAASSSDKGFGTFGYEGEKINGVVAGHELLDRTAAIIHGRVGEDGPLSTFYDDTNGPEFPDNPSAIRILHNGRNLRELGLTPVCKTITGPTMPPPPKGVFYIDPRWGRFLLPRPAYWSKMENEENVTTRAECRLDAMPDASGNISKFYRTLINRQGNYELGEDQTLIWLSRDDYGFESIGGLPAGGKFGNCFTMFWESDTTDVLFARKTTIESRYTLYPFGDQILPVYYEGTISFWGMLDTYVETRVVLGHESHGESWVEYRIAPTPGVRITIQKSQTSKNHSDRYNVKINNIMCGTINGAMMHFYITWIPVDSGKSTLLKVVISDANKPENNIRIEQQLLYGQDTCFKPYIELYGLTESSFEYQSLFARALSRAWSQIDNIKWYTHNVSDDPSWEYHDGDGREEALHPVYGPETEYSITLDHNMFLNVGYFFIPYYKVNI